MSAHRERRRREAEASGQRAEETGGRPVTLGITRAVELVRTLEKLTAQHANTLTRAITELRAALGHEPYKTFDVMARPYRAHLEVAQNPTEPI